MTAEQAHLIRDDAVENIDTTGRTGPSSKELEGRCLEVAGATALLEFFLNLKEKGIGTNPIESKARSMQKERISKERVKGHPLPK